MSVVVVVLGLVVLAALCSGLPVSESLAERRRQNRCPTDPLGVGNTRISTTHDGQRREYVVHIPTRYNNSVPVPLVFDIHGYTSTAEGQARYSGMRDVADANMFVVVNPEGTGALQSWNGGDCCVGNNEDDIGFFLRMLDEVSSEHACIDLSRVYAGGWSNGGFMSHWLACETDVLAAIGPVAGTVTLPCRASQPVALWHIHGTDDRTIPYDGNFAYESAPASQNAWADINDCGTQSQIVYQQGDTRCVSRYNCRGNVTQAAESVLCTVDGGSHAYDFTREGINSAQTSWEFYRRFARP